jgi:Arc/MetJ-type ribon-helix-helix transcriptional regulator
MQRLTALPVCNFDIVYLGTPGLPGYRKYHGKAMTIKLNPEQERAVQNAIQSGLFQSVDEFIDLAIAGLPHRQPPPVASRKEAVRRMQAFGDQHRLSLGGPVTRKLAHQGHRY